MASLQGGKPTLRFHERHFPTFIRFPHVLTRPVHWSAHLGMVTFVTALVFYSFVQTVNLVNLRHAVAEREADEWIVAPFGTMAQESLLAGAGKSIICEPALLRWYYGTGPLCDAQLGGAPAADGVVR
jgi:hypothetical protein